MEQSDDAQVGIPTVVEHSAHDHGTDQVRGLELDLPAADDKLAQVGQTLHMAMEQARAGLEVINLHMTMEQAWWQGWCRYRLDAIADAHLAHALESHEAGLATRVEVEETGGIQLDPLAGDHLASQGHGAGQVARFEVEKIGGTQLCLPDGDHLE